KEAKIMAKKQSGLGRDLYSLFDDNLIEDKKDSGTTLKIADIEPRKDQPRKLFEREALEALADSISNYGVLQPIIVHENTAYPGKYEIIAGERRWRAAKMAGLSEIPVVILTGDELKMAQVSLIENLQREDLNPVEEAAAYLDLIDKFGLTQDAVAKQVGKSRSAITNTLRLLDLPDEVLELLRSGELSAGHARALLGLNDKDSMAALAHKIIDKQLSVREVESMIKKLNAFKPVDDDDELMLEGVNHRKIYMKELERKLRETLGRKAKIAYTPKKKVLELSFDSDEDLENLLTAICGATFFSDDL
ncbi:MAG: ParB/RepB/Spo0J family partition protein, partial [Eubacteriales bacterium]|nr:ParB/RepB/Spo0J family partition protein [Eubacteriales bacterium]